MICYVFLVKYHTEPPIALIFGCDQALVAALAAGAAPKLRELKLYRRLWGGEQQLVFMGSQEQRNQRKSDSVMWGGCMTHSEHSKLFVSICCVNDCNSVTPVLRSNEFGQLAETMLTQGLPVFRKDLKARLLPLTVLFLRCYVNQYIICIYIYIFSIYYV